MFLSTATDLITINLSEDIFRAPFSTSGICNVHLCVDVMSFELAYIADICFYETSASLLLPSDQFAIFVFHVARKKSSESNPSKRSP